MNNPDESVSYEQCMLQKTQTVYQVQHKTVNNISKYTPKGRFGHRITCLILFLSLYCRIKLFSVQWCSTVNDQPETGFIISIRGSVIQAVLFVCLFLFPLISSPGLFINLLEIILVIKYLCCINNIPAMTVFFMRFITF